MKQRLRHVKEWWSRRQYWDKIIPPILAVLILFCIAWQPVSAAVASAAKDAAPAVTGER